MTDETDETSRPGDRPSRPAGESERGTGASPGDQRSPRAARASGSPPSRAAADGRRSSTAPEVAPLPLRSRTERAERAARDRAVMRNRLLAVGGAILVVVLLASGAVLAFGHEPGKGTTTPPSPGATTLSSNATSSTRVKQNDVTISTPVFAEIRGVNIYLPVPVSALTGLMFHQASGTHSYPMRSLEPDANRAAVFKAVKGGAKLPLASSKEGTKSVDHRDGETILDSYWNGKVVRVYRMNRIGKPDTAADTGAKAGTPVIAPLSGTVTRIRAYKLYGRYPDYEIHIRPDALPDIDLVVIHVQDLLVHPGDWVIGGVTPIAHVRLLSNRMKHQLGEYTGEQGDHTHIQFNRPKTAGGTDEAPTS